MITATAFGTEHAYLDRVRFLAFLLTSLLLAIGLVAGVSPAHAEDAEKKEEKAEPKEKPKGPVIRGVEILENSKTKDSTVMLIADIEIGDSFDYNMVDRIRADLVNSGLFKDVDVSYAPVDGGFTITIIASDKHSWIVAPTYYNQPTNQGGGLGFGENNLFGENKKLLVYGQIATGDSFFIAGYIDPSIGGTPFHWQADLYLKRERTIEYAPPTELRTEAVELRRSKMDYLNGGLTFGVNLFRGASIDLRLRGAKVSFNDVELAEGASLADVTGDPAAMTLPDPGAEGWDVSGEVHLDIDRRANWYGISHGDRYRLDYSRALPELGSDFEYWSASLRWERARKYFDTHNLILKAKLSYGVDLPFQQEFTAGGTALRGYKNNQFRGDAQAMANIEYSLQAISIKGVSLRLLGFLDTSYTTFLDTDETDVHRHYLPEHDRLRLEPFKNTVGLGTRLYVRQIVLPLLGLDVGWGLERGDYEIYLAIGLTDV